MTDRADPRAAENHFAFGENWRSFVDLVDEDMIAQAVRSLERLLPRTELAGRTFLDIGCGSGLSMLAASRLGAASLQGIDIDPQSVAAAQALMSRFSPNGPWQTRVTSVFDLDPARDGTFDVVHSWGVLHHSGDMWTAVRRAAALVAPGGGLVLALYRRTPLCGFWTHEKRVYSRAGRSTQAAMRALFKATYAAGLIASGRNPVSYIQGYKSARGMDWSHDVHDWLGGYPYESVLPDEVRSELESLGFTLVRVFEKPAAVKGLLGSHCDEFVAVRSA